MHCIRPDSETAISRHPHTSPSDHALLSIQAPSMPWQDLRSMLQYRLLFSAGSPMESLCRRLHQMPLPSQVQNILFLFPD